MIKRILRLLLEWALIKNPLQLIAAALLIPITYKYELGRFPRVFAWFDDYRARNYDDLNQFGIEHARLFHEYNSTWLKRWIWSAWRNKLNGFVHTVLGKSIPPGGTVKLQGNLRVLGKLWEYSRTGSNLIKIPGLPVYIRVRLGYALYNRRIGIPCKWMFDMGVRLK
jgi:hypothetical protein